MKPHRWKPRSKMPVPTGVKRMLATLGPLLEDGGRAYRDLARSVEAFLAQRGQRGWARLDVEAFVGRRARSEHQAIRTCRNLSALLPHLIKSGELSQPDAARLWLDLFDVCPQDEDAQAFIMQGLRQFGDFGQELPKRPPTMPA